MINEYDWTANSRDNGDMSNKKEVDIQKNLYM